jgi:hypothetical protein
MIAAVVGVPEFMSVVGFGIILAFAIGAIVWLCYCISSIARAADALERIANALEDDDDDGEEGGAA